MRDSTAGPAWDHMIRQRGLVLLRQGHTQEQECAASWRNSQEKELPYNEEAQEPCWLTLLAGAFSPKPLEQETASLVQSEVWSPVRKNHGLDTTFGQRNRNRRDAKRSDAYNRNTKELLNWHACKKDLEEKYKGNGPINAQRGISTS